jgi:hypothetical protein
VLPRDQFSLDQFPRGQFTAGMNLLWLERRKLKTIHSHGVYLIQIDFYQVGMGINAHILEESQKYDVFI